MKETVRLCGLLLLSLLAARSWGQNDAGTQCMNEITPPNVTEIEVTQMALCHVHCIDQYYSRLNFNLTLLPGFPTWDIIPRDLLHINLRGPDCLNFKNLMDCRRGCMIQSRSSSSDCTHTCVLDECVPARANLVPPCGCQCSEDVCMTGCGTVFDTVMNSVNAQRAFPPLANPVAPPNLTQVLDEVMQPTARYRVDISGAVSQEAQFIRGGFSSLIFRVQNTSSGEFYYFWVEEDELNLEAFNHQEVNVSFAVATVAFGTSSYSPAVTLQVEAIEPVLDFPEQLLSDSISFSFTRDNRTDFAGNFLFNISWERPEDFERVIGYTVSLSALGTACGVPATYELEPTQTGLDLESSSSHSFRFGCFFTVMVQVNPRCPSDTVATTRGRVPRFADSVLAELVQGATVSCPAEFNDRFIRYDVAIAWTLEITPLVLGLINHFIVRTSREFVSGQQAPIPLNDNITVIPEDESQMNFTLPRSYGPIIEPNTAFTIGITFVWDRDDLPSYNLNCFVGTLPPEAPGVVANFTRTDPTITETFEDGRRMVDVTVNYTWLNLQPTEGSTIDYEVWFADTLLAADAEPPPDRIDSYGRNATRGTSSERFTSSQPVFTAYLQIRARATYGIDATSAERVISGNWNEPLEVTIDVFNPPAPEELLSLMAVNSSILEATYTPGSTMVEVTVSVDIEWTQPGLEFGSIQRYEAWLNFTRLDPSANPENVIYTFEADDRSGTIVADFIVDVEDRSEFELMLQMRSTSNFGISSVWNIVPSRIELTAPPPPSPGTVARDDFNITNTTIERQTDFLVITLTVLVSEPDVLNGNLTLVQVVIGPEPVTGLDEPPPGNLFDIPPETTSRDIRIVLPTTEPDSTEIMNRSPRQILDDFSDAANDNETMSDDFVILYLQVRSRNEFTAGPWSEPIELNITVPEEETSDTPVPNPSSDDTNIVAIVVPIAVVAAVILAIIVLVPSVWFYRRWRQSRKWENYIREGNEDGGARITGIDPRQPSYPLAPLPIDKAPLLDEWEVSADDVIVEKQLGEGAFGEVFKGAMKGPICNPKISSALKHTIGLPVAIKLLNEPRGEYSHLDAKPPDAEAVEEQDPYLDLGELEANDLMKFAYEISTGMEYLTSLNIVHRDLACRNILIGEGKKLKITDFGLSREVEEVYVKKTKGRLPLKWMAIECIVDREFTTQSDVWAYGVTLWEIGTLGGFPYPTVPNQDLLNMLKQGYRLEKPDNCAPEVYEIMLECWNEDPHDRPNFSDLRAKFGALLLAGKEDQYITLEVDEMKPYYTVKEAEEDEQRERSGSDSSEESIEKMKGKKEGEHKDLKTKLSNPYVDHPARQSLQSQTSQPLSLHSQPSLHGQSQPSQPQSLRGPTVPMRPLVNDKRDTTDPYFDQLPTRPIPQPSQGSIPEE